MKSFMLVFVFGFLCAGFTGCGSAQNTVTPAPAADSAADPFETMTGMDPSSAEYEKSMSAQ
jgi:hypothetical protein